MVLSKYSSDKHVPKCFIHIPIENNHHAFGIRQEEENLFATKDERVA